MLYICGDLRNSRVFRSKESIALGYNITIIYRVWHYSNTTRYDPSTAFGGIFAGCMNTFIGLKMEVLGFPAGVVTDEEKRECVRSVVDIEGMHLNIDIIEANPSARAVEQLCLDNLWGKLDHRSYLMIKKFVRGPREIVKLMSYKSILVTDFYLVNEECVHVAY